MLHKHTVASLAKPFLAVVLALGCCVSADARPAPIQKAHPNASPPVTIHSGPLTNNVKSGVQPLGNALGVQAHWDFASGGYLITFVDPNGDAANLPDGTYLEPGDVIVQVGNAAASPNRSLQGLLQSAAATGNNFISVVDVNSGVSFFHPF